MIRRRRPATGFVMAEALVALAIAAMTLALLTSATWGLRLTVERRAVAIETSSADWLAARRALLGWASGVTAVSSEDVAGRFVGTATTARMVVEPGGAGSNAPFVAELRVEAVDENTFALIAARHFGPHDARVAADQPQETEVVRTNAPIRLLYLLPREGVGVGTIWRYETGSGDDGLPSAVAVEVGDERVLTARIFATMSASCLAQLGAGGLQQRECELR